MALKIHNCALYYLEVWYNTKEIFFLLISSAHSNMLMYSHVARLKCHQCKIQHGNALNMLKSIERYRTHPSHIFKQLDKASYRGSGTSADQRNQTVVSLFGQGWAPIGFYILGLGAPFSELGAPSTARFSFLWFHILSESNLFSWFCRHS